MDLGASFVARFRERGHAVTPVLFEDAVLDGVQREIERLWSEQRDAARRSNDARRLAFTHARPELPRLHLRSAVLSAFCRSEEFARLALAVSGGGDVDLFYNQAYAKAPGGLGQTEIPWHQDAFYAETDRLTFNCWVAVTDMTPESGTMRYVDRPGDARLLDHEWNEELQFYACKVDEREATPLRLRRGQAFVYGGRVPHGSAVNTTPAPRIAYSVAFAAAGVRLRANGEPFGDRVAIVRRGEPVAKWMLSHARGEEGARRVAEAVLGEVAARIPDGDREVAARFDRYRRAIEAERAEQADRELGDFLALVPPDVEVNGDLSRARARVDQLLSEYARLRGSDPTGARRLLERILELEPAHDFATRELDRHGGA